MTPSTRIGRVVLVASPSMGFIAWERIGAPVAGWALARCWILGVMGGIDVSTRVGWPVYVGLVLLFGWLVWILIAPDYWWRKERALVGWQYRDGHRIELSTAGRIWARFWTVVGLVILCVVGGATVNWTAAARVETEPWGGLGGRVYYVGDPVESPSCTVRVFVCLRSDMVFPIEVTGYETVEPGSDERLTKLDKLPDDTNLLLHVEWPYFPTRVVVDQGGEQVTVTVYGKCAPWRLEDPYGRSPADCATNRTAGTYGGGVVPVSLDKPLDGRPLIDGSRDAPVASAR